jgi:hypothetical protein
MASILKVDTITGVATAGSIAVTGEGNSTTTNLQQGLCKAWLAFDGTATTPAARGSFNHSSITDNDTGDYTNNFTNSFADVNYAPMILGSHDASNLYTGLELVTIATGSVRFHTKFAANATKYNMTDDICTVHGDLA